MSDDNPMPPGPPPGDPPADPPSPGPPPPPADPPPPGPGAAGYGPPPGSPPGAGTGGGAVSDNRSLFLVLAYLGPFALIPFLVEKDDQEVLWHSKHGLVLFAAEIVLWIALWIFNFVVTAIFAPLGCLVAFGFLFLGLGIFGFHIFLIFKAVKLERVLIPGVSQYADQF